ncbi:D-ribitol-5-phosphate cytidylyltransferase-like isoform X2 [Portunus trituberculatus]|nr:D-ribitol-5-phosphate cytidylyltransferase-like isoform X2 [Portunus trituberculatus]XP_045101625.1 D-ribitol-5-phosphate cytidylyltransferase-like isoform X2 [Portunus trituberculatus]
MEKPQGRVAAVVPAAGTSERMGSVTPKQYIEVCGRPLVTYCLEALQSVEWVSRVVVVADDLARMREVVQGAALSKVTVIQGGGSRHRSIRMGVEALAAEEVPPDVVVVHDGARPFVPLHTLAQVAVMAERHGAAGAVRSLVSTVVMPDAQDFLEESLVRSLYRNSEMPQAFRFSVLRDAYRKCSDEEADHGTECLALALRHCRVKAKLVPGTPQLWKVTEEKDLEVARVLLPRLTRHTTVVCSTLASSQLHHTAGAAHSSDPFTGAVTCREECSHVFSSLEDTLRRSCKKLHFSPRYNATHASLIVITNITCQTALVDHLKAAAADISKTAGPVIFLFNQHSHDPSLNPLSIVSMQQEVRDTFSNHAGPVTVILNNLTRTEATKGSPGVSKGQARESDHDQPPPDLERLRSLVASLLDQTSRGFHGLVLVV